MAEEVAELASGAAADAVEEEEEKDEEGTPEMEVESPMESSEVSESMEARLSLLLLRCRRGDGFEARFCNGDDAG